MQIRRDDIQIFVVSDGIFIPVTREFRAECANSFEMRIYISLVHICKRTVYVVA